MTRHPKPSQGPLYACHYWHPGDRANRPGWCHWGEEPIRTRAELVDVILTVCQAFSRQPCADDLDVLLIEDRRALDITEQAADWANWLFAEDMGGAV